MVHLLNCAVLYLLSMLLVDQIMSRHKLILSEDDKYILDEIVFNDKKLKEVDSRKANTISKKLTVMSRRNNCKNNEELYEKYRESRKSM